MPFPRVMDAKYCPQCGAAVIPGGKFCPNCGTALSAASMVDSPAEAADAGPAAAPTRAAVPAPIPIPVSADSDVGPTAAGRTQKVEKRGKKRGWLIGLVIILALGFLTWALLAGLPFGRDEDVEVSARSVDVVEEQQQSPPPAAQPPMIIGETATVVELPANMAPEAGGLLNTPGTTTVQGGPTATPPPATPPPGTAPPMTAPPTAPGSPPRPQPSVSTPPPARAPEPPRPVPPDPRTTSTARAAQEAKSSEEARNSSSERPGSGEISGRTAVGLLDAYLGENNPYDVDLRCLSISNAGYRNVGYTLTVRDSCEGKRLGQWRVDSKTREIFRQRDGRFVRP